MYTDCGLPVETLVRWRLKCFRSHAAFTILIYIDVAFTKKCMHLLLFDLSTFHVMFCCVIQKSDFLNTHIKILAKKTLDPEWLVRARMNTNFLYISSLWDSFSAKRTSKITHTSGAFTHLNNALIHANFTLNVLSNDIITIYIVKWECMVMQYSWPKH